MSQVENRPDTDATLPAAPPLPIVPRYDGPCLANVVPALAGGDPPPWLPSPVARARQVVLLVLDGLGWEQLCRHRADAPVLASGEGSAITSVVPSTTATALTSLVTGLPPAVHGVVGYRLALEGRIMNVLKWRLGGDDARGLVPAGRFQPHPAFPGWSRPIPVVSRADYRATGFSAAHLGDATLHGWATPSGLVVETVRLVRDGEPFVVAYYDGIDRVAHAHGLGEHYRAELRAADRLVGDLLGALPGGTALVVTADHGQVDVGRSVEVLGGELMDGVTLLSGEGRFRWLHVRPGAEEDVAAAATEVFGHLAWVRTRQQVIDEGWLGGEPIPGVAERLGHVALVPFAPTAFFDPADTGEQRLVSRHGSLTAEEMHVPLLSWAPPG